MNPVRRIAGALALACLVLAVAAPAAFATIVPPSGGSGGRHRAGAAPGPGPHRDRERDGRLADRPAWPWWSVLRNVVADVVERAGRRLLVSGHSPGGKSVEAARSACASKAATRSLSTPTVPCRACDPSMMRSGAGCWSALAMMAAAIRAGSPGASPSAGSSMARKAVRRVAVVGGQQVGDLRCRSGTRCGRRRARRWSRRCRTGRLPVRRTRRSPRCPIWWRGTWSCRGRRPAPRRWISG
jgi:hypothetical protein